MKLKYIKLKNFKSYPDQETKLDLDFQGIKLIVGQNGCLAGDTIISFNRSGDSFETTIDKAYKLWNGLEENKYNWDKSVPTFVRSYKEDINEISLHEIDNIVYSGEKEVFLLTLNNGLKIKATSNHEFFTSNGWKRVDELNNDLIAIDKCFDLELINKKNNDDKVFYKYFENFNIEFSKLDSIKKIGIEKTYDIICKDPYRNFSANGIIVHNSGKTTFFDAIIWGLYGKSMTLADDVINWKTGKNCKVEICFSIGKDLYSVIRYRNHEENGNKILFFKNNKNISQRTNGDTQEKITEVIQISYTAMISSVIFSSELYNSFLRSKPSDRLKSLESILSLKDVNEYAKKLKKLREPLLEEINKLETDKVKLVSSCDTLSSNIDEYNEKVKANLLYLKKQKEEIMAKVKEIETRLIEFKEIDVDKELKNNEEYDKIKELNRITKEAIEKEKLRIKDVGSLVNQYNELRQQYEDIIKINIADELRLIENYEKGIEINKKIEEDIEKAKNKIVDYSHAEVRVKQLKSEIEKTKGYINDLKENTEKCPVCKQPVKKELTLSLIDEETNKLKSLELEYNKFELEIRSGKEINKKIEEDISKLKEKIVTNLDTPKYTKEFLAKVSSNVENLNNQISFLKDKIKESETYNEEINERIKELNSNLVKLNDKPKYHTLFLENLKKKINELELEAEELRNEAIVIDTKAKSSYDKDYVEETKKKIDLFNAKIKKINKSLEEKKFEDRHYEVLSQMFSNKEVGFKKFFINKIIKIFNERVNFYLSFFFDDDIEITFDKDLNEFIKRNKKEVNFNSFSSGQKTRFELAISFAMFMLVKTFFSNTVNILVFDEILDRNLDQKGFNSVVEILENLGKNNSVFVVSHQEFYKERFNHHIQIKLNEEGFSYIYKEV